LTFSILSVVIWSDIVGTDDQGCPSVRRRR